jgi:isopenicillin-N N-acyltransferase-like protein
MWLCQTWDWICPTLPVVLKIKQATKPTVITLVEAGQLGKMGFNETGLGLALNWLESSYKLIGVPVHIISRAVLNSSSVLEAVTAIYKPKRGAACNYLLAHKDGFAIDFETTPDDVDYFEPEEGVLVHTNHFVSSRLRECDHGVILNGDSFTRLQRARRLILENMGRHDFDTIVRIQRDHVFSPFSICTHPIPSDPEYAQWTTLAGLIIDLENLQLHLACGNPCVSDYGTIKLGR